MEIILTENIKKVLHHGGFDPDSVIYTAYGDLSAVCEYTDYLLLLTRERIILLRGEKTGKATETSDSVPDSAFPPEKTRYTQWELSRCAEIAAENKISGGALILKTYSDPEENLTAEESTEPSPPIEPSHGEPEDTRPTCETVLFAYSNQYAGALRAFGRIMSKIKNNEELCEKDFETDDKRDRCPKCGGLYPDKNRKMCPKCLDKRSVFARMMSYFSPYRGALVLLAVCFVANTLLSLALPYLSGEVLYEEILRGGREAGPFLKSVGGERVFTLIILVATMALLKLISQIFGIGQMRAVAKTVPMVITKLKSDIFDSMGRLSVKFYSGRQTGTLMTRILDDANEVTSFFIDGLPFLFVNGLTIIATIAILLVMNWKLSIAAIVIMPFLTVVSAKLGPVWWSLSGKRHRASSRMNAQINDNITGARVVKGFGQEEQEQTRFRTYSGRVREADVELMKFNNKFYALFHSVEELASLFIMAIGAWLILGPGELSFGTLISFLGYVAVLRGPLDFMSFIFRWWSESLNSAQRMFEIIDAVPDISEDRNPVIPEKIEGKIELKNVSFSYEPGKNTLKNISFSVNPGEMLGIVGQSGAGKSTLVNIISRLYDPDEGEILLDGINIKKLPFNVLRRSIALVSQETYIFVGTVAENIAYGAPEVTREQILAASRAAFAHEFICKLPDGYDTMIGTGGRELSGGERQRLSIARAIVMNPRILILDEATASVDTETEQNIEAALTELSRSRTTLSIAHRLSTLRSASRLIVLENGELTEEGSHGELYEKKGTYYRLQELQSKALALKGIG